MPRIVETKPPVPRKESRMQMSYATLKCRRHGYGGDPRWLAPPTKRTGHVLTAEVQIEGQEGKEQH